MTILILDRIALLKQRLILFVGILKVHFQKYLKKINLSSI